MNIKEYIKTLNKKQLDSLMDIIEKRYLEINSEEKVKVRYTKVNLINFILEKQPDYQMSRLYGLSRYELYLLAQKYGLK